MFRWIVHRVPGDCHASLPVCGARALHQREERLPALPDRHAGVLLPAEVHAGRARQHAVYADDGEGHHHHHPAHRAPDEGAKHREAAAAH